MPVIGELIAESDGTYINVCYHINAIHRLNISNDLRHQLYRELSDRINEIDDTEQNRELKRHLRSTIRNLE